MNAQQLKNSILQLAVQGKLVPQDPNDEPASALIERIRAKRERLIKEKKIKPDKNPSYIFRGSDNLPYEKVGKNEPICIAEEVPFDIPDSWEWVRLKNLSCYIFSGKSPKYSKIPTEHKIIGQQANQDYGIDFNYVKYATNDFVVDDIKSLVNFIHTKNISMFLFGKVPEFEEDVILPKRATSGSAGYDIFSPYTFTLKPGESKVVNTGLNVLLGANQVLMIYPRSGLGFKYKAQLANTVGIIDSDYILSDNHGNIMIKIFNDGDEKFSIEKGSAFAQAICVNYFLTDDDMLSEKKIRNGGFGSTG